MQDIPGGILKIKDYISKEEFMTETGLGITTASKLYDSILQGESRPKDRSHRRFTRAHVDAIKSLQIGVFDLEHRLRRVEGYDNYWVSPEGILYTYGRGFFETFKLCISRHNGYAYVNLFNKKTKKHYTKRFHRLVAEAFLPNPENHPAVHHKDGNKLNNAASNLEWVSISQNTKHAYEAGLASNAKGSADSQSKAIVVEYEDGTNLMFGSIREAGRELGILYSTLSKILHRGNKSRDHKIKVYLA